MKPIFFIIGFFFIFASFLLHFFLAPKWLPRLPEQWGWRTSFEGVVTFPDPQTGNFPTQDTPQTYERIFHIISENQNPRAIQLEDRVKVQGKTITNVIWEKGEVDSQTGEHLQEKFRGDHYVFPQRVQKKTYTLRYSYLKGIPLAFQKEEKIDNLTTYLFTYQGRGEWTELYKGTEDFPGIPVHPNEEIKCANDAFNYAVWIEPVTGEVVKIQEGCYTGDYVYNKETGQKKTAIVRWGGTMTQKDIENRIQVINHLKEKQLWIQQFFPLLFLLMGMGNLGFALFVGRQNA